MALSSRQKGAKASSASAKKDTHGADIGRDTDASASVEDAAPSSSKDDCTTANDAQLREKAKLALLREAKRGAERAETMGTQGWRLPSSYATNKRFLSRTLAATMSRTAPIDRVQNRKRQRSSSPKEKQQKAPNSKTDGYEKRSEKIQSSATKRTK